MFTCSDDYRLAIIPLFAFPLHDLTISKLNSWKKLNQILKQDCGYIKHGNMKHNFIEKSGLILYSHLSPLEENVLSLVIVVELDILVWDAHLEWKQTCTRCSMMFQMKTLVTGMDSPVSMDSLTTQLPSTSTASHSTV